MFDTKIIYESSDSKYFCDNKLILGPSPNALLAFRLTPVLVPSFYAC